MTPFHVGMKVVCVDVNHFHIAGYGDEILPTQNKVYTIRDIFESSDRLGKIGLRLVEIENELRVYRIGDVCEIVEPVFTSDAFRPAHENRIEELSSLLVTPPVKKKERVAL